VLKRLKKKEVLQSLVYYGTENLKISVPKYKVTHKSAENLKISALRRLKKNAVFQS